MNACKDCCKQNRRYLCKAGTAIMKRVLAIAFTTKYISFAWEPVNIVFSLLTVIALESNASFASLQCTFHQDWAITHGSTLGSGPRYTPSDCFETFPFPLATDALESIGERYYAHRQAITRERQEGLTATYNRFHNPGETAGDIVRLRELHREMDEAVAWAYGWDDLPLDHGFHETKQGTRYTISDPARREVLDRLLALNHERHAEEVVDGLVDASGKPLKSKSKSGGKRSGVRQSQSQNKSKHEDKARVVEAVPVRPLEGGLEQQSLF